MLWFKAVKINVRKEGDRVIAATFSNERKVTGVKLAGHLASALGDFQALGVEMVPGRAGRPVIIAGEAPSHPEDRLIRPRQATIVEGIALILGMMESENIGVFGKIRAAQIALKDCDQLGFSVANLRVRYPEVFGGRIR